MGGNQEFFKIESVGARKEKKKDIWLKKDKKCEVLQAGS